MREPVLLALVHIFAILSNVNPGGVTTRGRKILRGYLKRYLNQELEEEYLGLFEETQKFYSEELSELGEESLSDESSLITFQITNICRQIRKGLFLDERMIVFLQLLEFVYEDGQVTDEEKKIIEIVSSTFSISDKEVTNTSAFMLGERFDDVSPDCMMIIEGSDPSYSQAKKFKNYEKWHRLEVEGLKGSLFILYIESISALIFTFQGSMSLYFKGRNIVKDRPYLLDPGVSIKGRDMTPIYYSGILREFFRDKYQERIIFEGHNIEYRFKKSDQGVKPMSFRADSGNLIGIMGGSGVGKSTLLNILNGKILPENGEIYLNGYSIIENPDEIKGLIGFIPQDDLLIEELSVYQNLYFNARLCFGDCSDDEIRVLVGKVIKDLEIDDIKHLQVGDALNKKISGGQRKRLNIGLELMREPSILFVDEPTSGLASHDSHKVLELLKSQTNNGKLVFAIIHQPSSDILKLFDRLWIMDKGGYMVYDGDPVDSLVYFKTETSLANAAESECPVCGNVETDEILQLIETKEVSENGLPGEERQVLPTDWHGRYLKSMKPVLDPVPARIKLPENKSKVPGKMSQLRTFLSRNILRKLSDRQYLAINLLEAPALAFILAYLSKYSEDGVYLFAGNINLPVFLFMSIVVALFMGLTVSAEEIFKDRRILERQKFLDISRSSYLSSKIAFLFFLSAIQTIIFILIANTILEIHDMIFSYWIILFSVSCFGNIMGLNISAGMRTVVSIYILIPLILVPQLLLGGAMIKFDNLHQGMTDKKYVPFIGDLMTTRWAYEAISVEQFKSNNYEKWFFEEDLDISQNDWYASFLIPELQKKVEECRYAIGKVEYRKHSEENFTKLEKYMVDLSKPLGIETGYLVRYFDWEVYNDSNADETNILLDSLRRNYRQLSLDAVHRKDSIIYRLEQKYGEDFLIDMKNRHYNQSLANIVLNRTSITNLYESEDQIIQKTDPVFMIPYSETGRSQFFAPYKILGRFRVDTLIFNVISIWLMNLVLYITLYFNLLKRLIDFIEAFRFPRANNGNDL